MGAIEDFVVEGVMGVLALFGGAGTRMYLWLKEIRESHQRIEKKLDDQADKVDANREIMREIALNTKTSAHYMKWLATESSGKEPPPPNAP